MGRLTEMSLLFVLFMASAAFGAVVTPTSEVDFNALVEEQLNAPTENVVGGKGCPYGWLKFNGRCYNYFSCAVDWASAETQCLNLGANLVSIHSEAENGLVKALIRAHDPKESPTWLGLSNCQKKSSWIWSDGSKFQYSKWNKNEPNHSSGECCVNTNWNSQKNWNDIPCSQAYPYVCTRRA